MSRYEDKELAKQYGEQIKKVEKGQTIQHEINEINDIDRKENWFEVSGDIRVNKKMTTKEFSDLLDSLGLEFLGVIKHSNIKDEDYK